LRRVLSSNGDILGLRRVLPRAGEDDILGLRRVFLRDEDVICVRRMLLQLALKHLGSLVAPFLQARLFLLALLESGV
jgi:hypothetical protein